MQISFEIVDFRNHDPYFWAVAALRRQPDHFSPAFFILLLVDSEPFYSSDQNNLGNKAFMTFCYEYSLYTYDRIDHLNKGNKLCKDEPVLDPLDVGGLSQPGHDADEQGGRGQHHRQVDSDRRVKKIG